MLIDKRSSMMTVSGRIIYPLDCRAEDIDLGDVATGLSNLCRFAGQVPHFYSVAQHSVMVSRLCPVESQLEGLLHDAPEAYLCDLPAPIKALCGGYSDLERGVYRAVASRFGIAPEIPDSVHRVDRAVLALEQHVVRKLALIPCRDFAWFESIVRRVGASDFDSLPPDEARAEFLARFEELNIARILRASARLQAEMEVSRAR